MIVGCSVAGGAGSLVAVAVVVTGAGAEAAESFGVTFLADFVDHHPSPLLHTLLHFCKWGNVVPMIIFLWFVWALSCHRGLLQFWYVLLF